MEGYWLPSSGVQMFHTKWIGSLPASVHPDWTIETVGGLPALHQESAITTGATSGYLGWNLGTSNTNPARRFCFNDDPANPASNSAVPHTAFLAFTTDFPANGVQYDGFFAGARDTGFNNTINQRSWRFRLDDNGATGSSFAMVYHLGGGLFDINSSEGINNVGNGLHVIAATVDGTDSSNATLYYRRASDGQVLAVTETDNNSLGNIGNGLQIQIGSELANVSYHCAFYGQFHLREEEFRALADDPLLWARPEPRLFFVGSPASTTDGVGTAAGASTASGVGQAIHEAAGSATGSATATAVGQDAGQSNAAGTAAGSAAAVAVGQAIHEVAGTAAGSSAASADGEAIAKTAGSAAGAATASATSAVQNFQDGAGSAAGSATATAQGEAIAKAAGSAAGSSSATAVGTANLISAAGTAAGRSTAIAVASEILIALPAQTFPLRLPDPPRFNDGDDVTEYLRSIEKWMAEMILQVEAYTDRRDLPVHRPYSLVGHVTSERNFNESTATLDEVRSVLGTLITDLRNKGILQ